jgi:ubiquinone/menaquinone biosynthesis C-methylase UbiE
LARSSFVRQTAPVEGDPRVVDKVIQGWNESAPYWKKHRAAIRPMFNPLTVALIEAAGILRGHSVLDIAGGTGEPALSIAPLCGPSGRVVCTDVVSAMLSTAKADAVRDKIENVRFLQCAGDCLPFRSRSFDSAVCRLGIMFFADPLESVREMLRVLKPDAKLALAVWHRSEANPFFYLTSQVIARHVEMPAFDPEAPGAFRFASPGKLASLLAQAGAVSIRERALTFRIEAAIGLNDFWTLRSEMSETIRELIRPLSSKKRLAIAQEVRNAVREFFANDRMSLPAEALIVSGVVPSSSF